MRSVTPAPDLESRETMNFLWENNQVPLVCVLGEKAEELGRIDRGRAVDPYPLKKKKTERQTDKRTKRGVGRQSENKRKKQTDKKIQN